MVSLKGNVALVTGATRGLGKGIALGLGEAGATVYITGRTVASPEDPDPTQAPGTLEETAAAVEQAGGICIPVQVDHRDDEQVHHLFEQIQAEQQGQLDLLVNNVFAGVQALKDVYGTPFWKSDLSLWDATHNVGLRSHYVASVYAARLMTPRKQGLICTISSWGGLSYIFNVAYGAGKSACDRLAADMAVELKPYGVTSLSIWPGIVGTELMTRFFTEMEAESSTDLSSVPEQSPANSIGDGFNWETPLFTGRVIAALAADPQVMRRTGHTQIVAELAQHYGIVDKDGQRPVSLRSLRFFLPLAFPALKPQAHLIPDIRIPWSLLLLNALAAPKV